MADAVTGAPAPRLGVGAFICDASGRLLLVQRRREPEAGHWGLPGGKVDFGETVEAAVLREIEEELGVVLRLDGLLCLVDQIDQAAGSHWVAPVYRAAIAVGEPANREPAALAAIGWFALDALPQPLTLATRVALEAAA
ncbi:NUDIX domain-containing protein [Inquilinus limosus]|uniref:NUDIX domain-containing protein n=1 Tax=Inquilinus limosus TaxID=171674 RepID=UPI0003F866CD|nr:NUDIX domain-containing protein [Inquilinus limosus]